MDQEFVRRVAAVLVIAPDPAAIRPSFGDDRVLGDIVELLRAAGGDAGPLGADALVAVFDDPAAAVRAATRLHLGAPGAPGERPLARWCAGIDVGDLLLSGELAAAAEAIDRAAALARLARPGTTAVAAAVVPALGRLRDAVVEPLGTEGETCLLVPRWSSPSFRERRAVIVLVGGAVLAGTGAMVWIAADRMRNSGDPRRLVLGIGRFRSSGSDQERAWIGPVLRATLSTQLSELSGVRVFSDEFVDFVMSREHLTAIEVAGRLGIEKMVSGSVLVEGDTVRVEAKIIDVSSGLLDGAYTTSGREHDLLALERDVVLGVIGKLQLAVSPEDEQRIAAHWTTDVEARRRVLDAEGEPAADPGGDPGGHDPEPHSSPLRWLEPSAAHAADVTGDVAGFLEEYQRATEAGNATALAALYTEFSEQQKAAFVRFYANVRDLRVRIDQVEAAVIGDEAVVSYTRTDDFIDVPTERPQQVSVRLTKMLRRVGGRWRFAAGR